MVHKLGQCNRRMVHKMNNVIEEWRVYGKKADFNSFAEKFGISPIIARIIRNRDIVEEKEFEEYLRCDLKKLNSPMLYKDMDKAIQIINKAIVTNEKIRVISDYDIDGICGGYILKDALINFGGNVDFDVPERVNDGYGINIRLIDKAYNDGVKLIITCDNGIAACEQIKYARSLGIKVIVTDHHEVPFIMEDGYRKYVLPEAEAVIDHKREDCEYPCKDLCGAAVGYKLVEAYFDKYVSECMDNTKYNIENKEKFFEKYLVFTAIATVGDIVFLRGENRTIVKNGLKLIKTVDNPGLQSLIDVNELTDKKILSYHISFVIGPCINSGGRIDTARRVFELFDCKDFEKAYNMAKELKDINEERKMMTVSGTENAIQICNGEYNSDIVDSKVMIVYLKNCHESLAGIIAGRLKDIFYKPVFVFTDSEGCYKGSGRSIEGYSMAEELTMANELYKKEYGKNLFIKFGGHKMAAGLSIERDKLEVMRKILNASKGITNDIFVRRIWIDVPLPFEKIQEEMIEQLDILEPFGVGNEKPVFAEKCIGIDRLRILGKNRNVMLMKLINNSGHKMDAVYFADETEFIQIFESKFGREYVDDILKGKEVKVSFNIIYYPEINEYNGYRNVRVVVKLSLIHI